MMHWSVVDVPIDQRASMRGSVFVRSQQEIFDDLARNEADYAAAWMQHKQIIDHGRNWGMCVPASIASAVPLSSAVCSPFTLVLCVHVQHICSITL